MKTKRILLMTVTASKEFDADSEREHRAANAAAHKLEKVARKLGFMVLTEDQNPIDDYSENY